LRWVDGSSPTAVLTGPVDDGQIMAAARVLLRYTRAETGSSCTLRAIVKGGEERILTFVHDIDEAELERLRIG
jgi:hypothetical protein